VLVAVDVLFGTFVLVQLGYLFGTVGTVLGAGVTFSDYAREGYFKLVAVVMLAGGLLIVAEAAGGRRPVFLAAALSLVGLTFVILASAAVRLALYLQVYGWTELRFYVAASIAWLAIGGALLALLIARDRIRWLAHGLAFAAIAVTLAVTAVGPQAFVTDRNIDRALDLSLVPPGGHTGLDADYLGQLGDDAIPSLVAALPRLDRATQAQLVPYLAMRSKAASREAPDGWAAWNLARERARAALANGP
jgi:peptidoglycan/LPS O-acetylase OafA/YrhL